MRCPGSSAFRHTDHLLLTETKTTTDKGKGTKTPRSQKKAKKRNRRRKGSTAAPRWEPGQGDGHDDRQRQAKERRRRRDNQGPAMSAHIGQDKWLLQELRTPSSEPVLCALCKRQARQTTAWCATRYKFHVKSVCLESYGDRFVRVIPDTI